MLQLTFLFVGLLGVLATAATLSRRLDHLTRTITAAFAMAVWFYWAVSAFSIEVATSNGVTAQTHIGLAAIGVAAGMVMLLSLAKLAFGSMASDSEVLDPHG